MTARLTWNRCVFSFLFFFLLGWADGPPPLAAQDIEVNSADPASAEQATLDLDVVIKGNGFGQDSEVEFLVTGTTDPGGIQVNSVAVKGPKRLVANIDVAESAVVGDFDIEVRSNGRRGKGTELFTVLEKGSQGKENAASLVRADFVDGFDIFSDGEIVSCGSGDHQYADFDDACIPSHEVISDLSKKGGRWHFRTVAPLTNPNPTRTLGFDFTGCGDTADFLRQFYTPIDDPVTGTVFLTQARWDADRVFKAGADRQAFSIWIPTVYEDGRWTREVVVDYVNPLFICPDPFDPDLRSLQTTGCGASSEDVSLAEVWEKIGSAMNNWILLGTCELSVQIRLLRIPCDGC